MPNIKPAKSPIAGRSKTFKDLKLQQMEMLLNVSRLAAAYETLDEILATLVDIMSTELDSQRSTLFLNDARTGELYSRFAQSNLRREIRILNTNGIAGHVYTTGKGIIVHDVYSNKLFNRDIDEQTDFITKSIICAPIKTVKGDIIGVAQALNKKKGKFTKENLKLLETITTQAAIALQSAVFIEQMQKTHVQEMEFLDVVSNITSEINLTTLLHKVMSEATRMLKADRSTLFLNDEKTAELFTIVGEGLGSSEIRFPNHLGIAGTVYTTGQAVNIPHAYADLRFNPAFDKKTGYFTRSILCIPVINKAGKTIGVTQILNKHGGAFTEEDESRLRAFTAQVAISLENAKLFNDVQNMKNYNESILESMTNAVITLDEDGVIITCNAAGLNIMGLSPKDILQQPVKKFFTDKNAWILEMLLKVEETQVSDIIMDSEMEFGGRKLSVNVTVLPLESSEHKKLGSLIMIEDISTEKRMKATMSRYMDPSLTDQLLAGGEDILGGKSTIATVLFSDIRGFTPLTEELGPQGTVGLLNEYFTIMVDCIQRFGGMLDKFIGDAIMAAFGMPVTGEDDEDRAVRAAIAMITDLAAWNAQRHDDGKKPVNMGVGLNTDVVVSGNIGSPKRMDYTLIGDGVNLASRLESACKQYSAQILISEYTYKKLRGTYRIREIDRVIVKGKTEPVAVYEVLDYHTEKTFPELMKVLNCFQHGMEQYRSAKWDEAIEAFKEALKLHPDDKLSQMYIKRCHFLKEHPPGNKWTGIWVMETK